MAVDEARMSEETEPPGAAPAIPLPVAPEGVPFAAGRPAPGTENDLSPEREAAREFARAAQFHRQGRLEEAIQGYTRVLALNPRLSDTYNDLGVALRSLGRLEAAVACYRRCLALRPRDPGIHSNLGNALRELGRYNRAAASHQQAVTLAPQSPVAIFNLGLVLRDLGHLDEAIGCFDSES